MKNETWAQAEACWSKNRQKAIAQEPDPVKRALMIETHAQALAADTAIHVLNLVTAQQLGWNIGALQ